MAFKPFQMAKKASGFGMLTGGGGGGGGGGSILKGLFGSKPEVPAFNALDINQEQLNAIAANQSAFGSAGALSNSVNLFNADQTRALSDRLFPGLMDQSTKNTASLLRGELSPDLLSNVRNETAATSMNLGLGGSQFQVGLTGGRFLQTAQQLQQQGQQNFERLQGMAPQQMGPQSMFLSSDQRVSFQYQQNADQWGRDWLSNTTAAGAQPWGTFTTDLMKSL